jgi:hypothetical protein
LQIALHDQQAQTIGDFLMKRFAISAIIGFQFRKFENIGMLDGNAFAGLFVYKLNSMAKSLLLQEHRTELTLNLFVYKICQLSIICRNTLKGFD